MQRRTLLASFAAAGSVAVAGCTTEESVASRTTTDAGGGEPTTPTTATTARSTTAAPPTLSWGETYEGDEASVTPTMASCQFSVFTLPVPDAIGVAPSPDGSAFAFATLEVSGARPGIESFVLETGSDRGRRDGWTALPDEPGVKSRPDGDVWAAYGEHWGRDTGGWVGFTLPVGASAPRFAYVDGEETVARWALPAPVEDALAGPAPALRVTEVSIPATATAGRPFEATAHVENRGDGPGTARVAANTTGPTYSGSEATVDVPPGDSRSATVELLANDDGEPIDVTLVHANGEVEATVDVV